MSETKESMQSIKEDLQSDLDSVQRHWIRIPVTLIITVMFIVPIIIYGFVDSTVKFIKDFTVPCLRGDGIIYKI